MGRRVQVYLRRQNRTNPNFNRTVSGLVAVVLVAGAVFQPWQAYKSSVAYAISDVDSLLPQTHDIYDQKLQSDKKGGYIYNAGYTVASESTGQSGQPKFTAKFGGLPVPSVSVTDPRSSIDLGFTPKFSVGTPQKDKSRVVYPIEGTDSSIVYTLGGSAVKEDIVLFSKSSDEKIYDFSLTLPAGTEARVESNGSLGVYGVSSVLLGSVTTGSEADAQLLEKARANGKKDQILFTIPAPVVFEGSRVASTRAHAEYIYKDGILRVRAFGLRAASYPLSIDPTVYIETARKLMRGNNETNIDFDPTNELIQKSQTSGARINGWIDTTETNSGAWGQAVATAGGYMYRAGGRVDPTMPYQVGSQATILATAGTTITANMPTIRPAGDLYLAFIAHKSTTAVTQAGGGWTVYANTRELSVFGKIGADQGGGNEQASYAFVGGSSEYVATIVRIKGFDATSGITSAITGTVGIGSDTSANAPIFPATTPATDAALVIRAAGLGANTAGTATAINPSAYGWLPSSHTQIYSGYSSSVAGANAALVVAYMDQPPLATVLTGTATLTNDGLIKATNGTVSIAVKAATVTAGVSGKVEWAQISTSSTLKTLDSPNPGSGVCSGWCNNTLYDLPSSAVRTDMAMIAYNGYLYALGGSTDGTAANVQTNVWIAKLGANGEPQLWNPGSGTKVYWYATTNVLPVALSRLGVGVYDNRLYIFGGMASGGAAVATVREADMLPTGDIAAWTTTNIAALPFARSGHSVNEYNGVFYVTGGNDGTALQATTQYIRISSDGTLPAGGWTYTTSFTTPRTNFGGNFSTISNGYIYVAGGCTAMGGTGSAFCTTIASDVQLASINADGTLAPWNYILTLSSQRFSHSLVAWQRGLYRVGGCNRQNTSTGVCYATHRSTQYGTINPDGDASTVSNSNAYVLTLTAGNTCSGFANGDPSLYNCDLPPPGDSAGQGGQMSSMVVVNNGYIYNIGGCTDVSGVGGATPCVLNTAMSGNTSYAALKSDGSIVAPAYCPAANTYVGTWCVDSTNRINTTNGVGAGAAAVFNGRIYVVGGTSGNGTWLTDINYVTLSNDGSLSGAWVNVPRATSGLPLNFPSVDTAGTVSTLSSSGIGYEYVFTRANPASLATNPGNLYVLGGCVGTGGIGCTVNQMSNGVHKCNIAVAGGVTGCSIASQLQIDADDINTANQGVAVMSGTIYANYVYLIGGACTQPAAAAATDPCGSTYSANRRNTIYAKIDNSNNIIAASGSAWKKATGTMSPVRRRAVAFGYNGYIYSLAGFSGTASLQDLLFTKIDVSTGDFGVFSFSGVVVTPRWDLRAVVSNGYVYAIGGCASTTISAPLCSNLEPQVQTFQLYNNDSGAAASFSAMSDDTFSTQTDRWGVSSTILNGYLYVAAGCYLNAGNPCTVGTPSATMTADVQYAPISSIDGTVGTWASATNGLGGAGHERSFGKLVTVGGCLYYLGGISGTTSPVDKGNIYTACTFTSGNITAAWSDSDIVGGAKGIGQSTAASRAKQPLVNFGVAVWDDRIGWLGCCASRYHKYIYQPKNVSRRCHNRRLDTKPKHI
jgi:hypothetical protein